MHIAKRHTGRIVLFFVKERFCRPPNGAAFFLSIFYVGGVTFGITQGFGAGSEWDWLAGWSNMRAGQLA
jgi:hypothetical protein